MTLSVQDSPTSYRPAETREVVREALTLTQKAVRGPTMEDPRALKEFLMVRLSHLEHEVFGVVLLDTRMRFMGFEELFRGTIDQSAVYSREVVKLVVQRNAYSVVLVHNHPSGTPEPSIADERITQRLKAALALIDVRVLDHIVVGEDFCESFAERGLL